MLRWDAPLWALILTGALVSGCVALLVIAARAAGLVG
jgi:hypothetical protein